MKCPFSGITYTANFTKHVALGGTSPHPMFALGAPALVKVAQSILIDSKATSEEIHLIGCALVAKLPLVAWDCDLLEYKELSFWHSFWLDKLEPLAALVHRISGRNLTYVTKFHVYANAQEGCSMQNLSEWIKAANAAMNERTMGITEEARKRNREFNAAIQENDYLSEAHCAEIIHKGIHGSLLTSKEENLFPELIAKWAARVGEFPQTKFQLPSGKKISIAQHWTNILVKGFKRDGSGLVDLICEDITPGDIEEIMEHCSVNIPNDNTFAIIFLRELGKMYDALAEFRAPKMAMSSSMLELLLSEGDGEVSAVARNAALRNTDPLAPKREDFQTLSSYLQAKKAYNESKGAAASSTPTDFQVEI